MTRKQILIVGLGNIGDTYSNTRHNVGFDSIDHIQKKFNLNPLSKEDKFKGLVSKTRIGEDLEILLLKPTTYMNLSGESVQLVMNFYKIGVENLIIIHDDLDLPIGTIKIHQKIPKSHNGVNSIKKHVGNDTIFTSIRIGIDARVNEISPVDYVLGKFRQEEIKIINDTIFPIIEKYIGELVGVYKS